MRCAVGKQFKGRTGTQACMHACEIGTCSSATQQAQSSRLNGAGMSPAGAWSSAVKEEEVAEAGAACAPPQWSRIVGQFLYCVEYLCGLRTVVWCSPLPPAGSRSI
jgi:hypothetical protein